MSYFEEKTKEWTKLIEQHSFYEVKSYLENLKRVEIEYNLFFYMLLSDVLLGEVFKQRVRLAMIVSAPLKVEVLPEDRGRVVYLLANCENSDLAKANQMFEKEFGPNFQLKRNYLVSSRNVSFEQLVKKAREIKRAIYNICYFQVQDIVNEILAYYKIFKVTDQDEILSILNIAQEIRDDLQKTPQISTYTEEGKLILDKAKALYKATGRIKMEIDGLDSAEDFIEIQAYAFYMSFVCLARDAAVKKNIDSEDFEFARKFLTRVLGQTKFMSLQDTDELQRLHKPLTLK